METLIEEEVSDNTEAEGWGGQTVSSDRDPDSPRGLITLHRTSLLSRMESLCRPALSGNARDANQTQISAQSH